MKTAYTTDEAQPESETRDEETAPETAKKPADAKPRTPSAQLGILRLLNSKGITFRYKVKDSTSAGATEIELWGTTDLRKWRKYDTSARTPGALTVEVKDEGLYGFTMVVGGKGETAKKQPPRPGDVPQVWVAVDVTKPDVELLGAELSVLSPTPTLIVRWTAKDQHFGSRPITLLYAERPKGPWLPFAANVENKGRYEWVLPRHVPSCVYVRVQAADLMGNVAAAQSAKLHIPERAAAEASPDVVSSSVVSILSVDGD